MTMTDLREEEGGVAMMAHHREGVALQGGVTTALQGGATTALQGGATTVLQEDDVTTVDNEVSLREDEVIMGHQGDEEMTARKIGVDEEKE